MSRWNVQDGLIHVLFANEDRYVLDSMVSLDLTEYLNYELHRRHFARILFVEGLQNSCVIRVFSEKARDWCEEQLKGLFGMGRIGRGDIPAAGKGMLLKCSPEQVRRLAAQASETAFVFRLDVFARVFRGCEDELEKMRGENELRRNLMILRAGVVAEDSRALFMDKKGIFQASSGTGRLFPEVVSAFTGDDPADEGCYVRLQRMLGDRCVLLNRFSRDAVRRAVRYTSWVVREGKDALSEEQLENTAAYVWKWYHDAAEQTARGGLLPEDPARSYDILIRDLDRYWKVVSEVAEASGPQTLEPMGEPGVISDSILVRKVPDEQQYGMLEEEKRTEYKAVCFRIRRLLRRPRVKEPDEQAAMYLSRFLDRLTAAVQKGDSDTVRRAESALQAAVAENYYLHEEDGLQWQLHDAILAQSARLFGVREDIRKDSLRLNMVNGELDNVLHPRQYVSISEKPRVERRALKLKEERDALERLINKGSQDETDIGSLLFRMELMKKLPGRQVSAEEAEQIDGLLQEMADRAESRRNTREARPPRTEAETGILPQETDGGTVPERLPEPEVPKEPEEPPGKGPDLNDLLNRFF